jgi:citronellol/citronellal dehydrogenase
MAASRTPEIVADSASEILRKPPSEASGNTFLDDEVLAAAGITDLSGYTAGDGDSELALDLFVADWPD